MCTSNGAHEFAVINPRLTSTVSHDMSQRWYPWPWDRMKLPNWTKNQATLNEMTSQLTLMKTVSSGDQWLSWKMSQGSSSPSPSFLRWSWSPVAELQLESRSLSSFHDSLLTYSLLNQIILNIFIILHYFLALMEELIFTIKKANMDPKLSLI